MDARYFLVETLPSEIGRMVKNTAISSFCKHMEILPKVIGTWRKGTDRWSKNSLSETSKKATGARISELDTESRRFPTELSKMACSRTINS